MISSYTEAHFYSESSLMLWNQLSNKSQPIYIKVKFTDKQLEDDHKETYYHAQNLTITYRIIICLWIKSHKPISAKTSH